MTSKSLQEKRTLTNQFSHVFLCQYSINQHYLYYEVSGDSSAIFGFFLALYMTVT